MDPVGATRREVARDGDGVVVVDVHARALAPLQAHDPAAHEVYGWEEDHASPPYPRTTLTKFASSERPAREDFSGWNWRPKTLSDHTPEAKLRA